MHRFHTAFFLVLISSAVAFSGCRDAAKESKKDVPRLTANVRMQDVSFHSSALQREMSYRVVLPKTINGNKLPVVYLLHGGGGGFRDWSNYSDVAHYAERGLILVMPEGGSSYYTNSAARPQERFEDYILNDLIADVETRFPAATDRSRRSIIGASMGGFGAIKAALKRPDLFVFAGGISSAIDVPTRPFSIKRIGQWRHHRSIFGEWQGQAQMQNDPYVLAQSADPAKTPYIYITCGDKEGLLAANRRFAALLSKRQFAHEFHVVPGGHDWNQWNAILPSYFDKLSQAMSKQPEHVQRESPPRGRNMLAQRGSAG
jgi:putative tributyrin esterase